jgi:hypothetical protein
MCYWICEFVRGREQVEDARRSGWLPDFICHDRIARSSFSNRRNWFSTAHENIDGLPFKVLSHIAKIICQRIAIECTCSGPYFATNPRLKRSTFLDFLQNQLWIWVYAILWRISDSLSVASLLFSSMNWTMQWIPFRVHSENEIEIQTHDPDWEIHDCQLTLQHIHKFLSYHIASRTMVQYPKTFVLKVEKYFAMDSIDWLISKVISTKFFWVYVRTFWNDILQNNLVSSDFDRIRAHGICHITYGIWYTQSDNWSVRSIHMIFLSIAWIHHMCSIFRKLKVFCWIWVRVTTANRTYNCSQFGWLTFDGLNL